MKIVIDTNILISAIVKNGFTRDFIINKGPNFEFLTPAYIVSEVNKHKKEIIKKANIDEEQFYFILKIIFKYINVINPIFYSDYLFKAKELIEHTNDVPFLACALALDCPIWSNDKHFQKQNIVKVLTTGDMLSFIK